jgi:hypothetical protein
LSTHSTGVVIVGGGPGGLAPLLAAHRRGRLAELLDNGVTVVEQSGSFGEGAIGQWCISSDSTGFTFADCLAGPPYGELAALREHPLTQQMRQAGEGTVPLTQAGAFLGMVGRGVKEVIAAHPKGRVLSGFQAISTQKTPQGWQTRIKNLHTGRQSVLDSQHVVLATGASQPLSRLRAETVAGVNLVERYGPKLLQSGDVVSHQGFAAVADRLAALGRPPRVAIIGGSTSAAAVAYALLHRMPSVQFGPSGLTLMHRRELRIYYPTIEAALADNYTEFGPEDICPVTRRVFRLGGFRLDSRDLIMRARGIGGRPPEPRLQLHRLGVDDAASLRLLDEADLVIAALGYRPHALPVFNEAGRPVPLFSETGPKARLVDNDCRVMDAEGKPLPGLFAIGLAAGFVPHGKLGGEPSFRGQANGLWLWQSDVGGLIVDAVLPRPWDEESDLDPLLPGPPQSLLATQEVEA